MTAEFDGVTWEHRITLLESAVTEAVQKEIRELRLDLIARIERWEVRLEALEAWRNERTEEIAHAEGLAEGRQGLRKSEMGLLAAAVTSGGVIAGIVPHIWGLIR